MANCNWTNNNLACVNTWSFLRVLKQFKNVFGDAGTLKMSQLTYWNKALHGGSGALQTEARGVAGQLDNMFITGLRAKYEPDYDRATAVESLVKSLLKGDTTVCELSVAVDEAYRFTGERM